MAEPFLRRLPALLVLCSSLSALFGCGGAGNGGTPPPPPSPQSAVPALSATVATQGNFSSGQSNASYTITVSDTGNGATTGTVTVAGPPTGFTVTGISGTGWTCTLASTTCTRSDSLAAGQSFPTIAVTGNVTSANGTPVTIPVTLSGGGTSSPVTVTPTPAITVAAPALSISKAHSGNFNVGQQGATYTVTVSNGASVGATNTKVTVTEAVPSGETLVSMSGSGWTCPGTGGANTCDRSDVLLTGASYPALTVTVNVKTNATSPQVNQVSVSGGGMTGTASASDSTTINIPVAPDLSIVKSHIGNFRPGSNNVFTLAVSNVGSGPTTGPVAVTDTLAPQFTFASGTAAGWSCSAVGQAVTCTNPGPIAPGASAVSIPLMVAVSSSASGTISNTATVATTGDTNAANNSSTDNVAVTAPAVATITVSPSAPSVAVGATQQFTATAKDTGGNILSGVTFTWASSATSVANINSSGLATGVSAGTTQITASANGIISSADTLTVTSPAPDFSISVSPSSVSTQMGTTSGPVTVSVTGLNGFSGSVSIAVSGLPAGIVCSPSCPLAVNANGSAPVSFVVPANARTGSLALTVQGTSGNLSHNAPLTLNVTTSLQGLWNLTQGSTLVQQNPAPVGSHFTVGGWAFEKIPLTSVSVLIDNSPVGNAFYGVARPGLAATVPGAPPNCGFSLGVDTTSLSNGLHTISVNVTDSANNVAALTSYPFSSMTVQISVNNPAPAATGPVAKLTLGAPTTSLVVGAIVQFTASATDAFGQPVSPSLSWSSTAPSIVKVTPTGVVLPLAAGNATISVSAGGQTQQLAVTVHAGSGAAGTIQVSLGPEEIVFRYTAEACMDGDYPDSPAHAVRLADGTLLLSAGHDQFWFSDFGKDFYSLKRVCSPQMISVDNYYASSFANRQWIFSLYNDGSVIHALIHNEFHDPIAPTCRPGDSGGANPCQYTSITYARSTDSGHTFTMPPTPQNIVAPPPVQWTAPAPGSSPLPYGYQEPLNIVHAADGFYYTRFGEFPPPGQPYFGGNCVMRTATLSDPSSWRAWDGSSFGLAMTDPYTGPPASLCSTTPVTVPYESLAFNTYLSMYMLVGNDSDFSASGPINCGFHFSLSSDLVNWSPQQFIAPAYLVGSGCGKPQPGPLAGALAYVSMIDHDDPSVNFETPGRTPYFYYTRFNDNINDRDLVRVPVIITKY